MQNCCICHKPITAQFWVCAECEKLYELRKPYQEWPAWAKFLATDMKKWRWRDMNGPQFVTQEVAEWEGFCCDVAGHIGRTDSPGCSHTRAMRGVADVLSGQKYEYPEW